MSRLLRTLTAATVAAVLLAVPAASRAYVPRTIDIVGGEVVFAHWAPGSFPLEFEITPGITTDLPGDVARAAVDRAMATWSSVSTSGAAMSITRERAVEADVFDGINAIEFSNDASLQGAGFLALTFLNTAPDGRILEADMLVNDREFGFTDNPDSTVGIDLETAMLRELGKILGLANSPLGVFAGGDVDEASAVMFPVARGVGESARILARDDAAGISALYPVPGSGLGTISGRVRRTGGTAVFGAHVIAFDPLHQVLVGAVTLPDGSFEIGGLPPGRYFLEARPLSAPATPATLGGIFDSELVNTGFRRVFLDETLRLDAGGSITGVTLEVQ